MPWQLSGARMIEHTRPLAPPEVSCGRWQCVDVQNSRSQIPDCMNEHLSIFASPIIDSRYRTAASE
jgi:hypothetical protein